MTQVRILIIFIATLSYWSIHLLTSSQAVLPADQNIFDVCSEIFNLLFLLAMLAVNISLAKRSYDADDGKWFFIGLLLLLCGHTHDLLDEFISINPLVISFVLENAANNLGVLVLTYALFKWSIRYKGQIKTLQEQKVILTSVSNKDPMTQLYNRRFLNDGFKKQLDEVDFAMQKLSLVMIDLDNFKSFNDSYGHLHGDKLIQHAAKVISEEIREQDFAFRYGGEEFLVVIEGDKSTAKRVANRILDTYRNSPFSIDGNYIHKTLSIGIKQLSCKLSFEESLNDADTALYSAKQAGRNCIVLSGETEQPYHYKQHSTATLVQL
ncbi:PAS domain S-box/diguanylate cyclase (GGDEF) domain-containing protein [Catenovulum agarivorans DS-2]|uniref:diguanylate cyclase n=1 Tax=Catenovulum agarivorans DS-2 TaxID=1328313 RepID=W7QK97_9ALTE|nr:GGDEF domain-containing protein [Catenovulum agarivorans]EWH12336.1 PAS domain S-box/diguanylate cyclase (GGDEF) domain-containing protein [Catenovulum agarivorans DS-2]